MKSFTHEDQEPPITHHKLPVEFRRRTGSDTSSSSSISDGTNHDETGPPPFSPTVTTGSSSSMNSSTPHMLSGMRDRTFTNDSFPTSDIIGPQQYPDDDFYEEDAIVVDHELYASSPIGWSPQRPQQSCTTSVASFTSLPPPSRKSPSSLRHPYPPSCYTPHGLVAPPRRRRNRRRPASSTPSKRSRPFHFCRDPPSPVRVTAISNLADHMNSVCRIGGDDAVGGTAQAINREKMAIHHASTETCKKNEDNTGNSIDKKENIPPSLVHITFEASASSPLTRNSFNTTDNMENMVLSMISSPSPSPPYSAKSHHRLSSITTPPRRPSSTVARPRKHRRNRTHIVFCGGST